VSQVDLELAPEASLSVRLHVRKALLRLLAQQASPERVIDYLSRSTADQSPAETWYTDFLAALPFAVYITDATGHITYYNEAAVALWGRCPVLGQERWNGCWRIYSPNGAPLPHEYCPMAVALREDKRVRNVTAVAERPDSSRVHYKPFPTPLHDANDNLVGAVNVLLTLGVE
jgi:PAS domain-containing protein